MKAMVLQQSAEVGSNPLVLKDVPLPEPMTGQVRVKVHVCGVCRTDLHIIEGELPEAKRPVIPGHQIVGVVDRIGQDVRDFKEGDRVGVAWLQDTCGKCEFCTSARENLCDRSIFTGYHVDGGFAEYIVASKSFVYAIPAGFGDEAAAPLLCAGIIGYRALRLSGIERGQHLGLYGFGAAAHIAIQVAKHWGCSVSVFSQRDHHKALARELGASWVGGSFESPPEKVHGAIMFAPVGELVPIAMRALAKGGTLAIAGIHMSPIPSLHYDEELFGERVMRSVTANTKQDGLDLLQIASAIPIKTHTELFCLDDVNIALQNLKAGKIQGAGVLDLRTG
ncbi:MAG TPA: zinc-binding alcohol dehydrogenase family protein [Nitrospirales bacterium]|nr:zinc-binding alcohol dehydrogenase family protein [Nitrospirales bacterium]HIC04155.1 zinc-binding alcohol dehydrogenase family protein [Nitrospirales bacterium]HIN32406.1 zinc-binding alcohol dehydrogenase family protein [Nitrospirales bacterium]HIO70259.1 zinc-binding alcohol dehydrogenase family protein [Nitrospirales bacterium]